MKKLEKRLIDVEFETCMLEEFDKLSIDEAVDLLKQKVKKYPKGQDFYLDAYWVGYEEGLNLALRGKRLETDAQLNSRIRQQEGIKKRKKTIQEKERKEYKRLKKKLNM